jgi:hypothetical protein
MIYFTISGNLFTKLGKRASVSSGLGRNQGRSLELGERRERKSVGAKVDILFKKKSQAKLVVPRSASTMF